MQCFEKWSLRGIKIARTTTVHCSSAIQFHAGCCSCPPNRGGALKYGRPCAYERPRRRPNVSDYFTVKKRPWVPAPPDNCFLLAAPDLSVEAKLMFIFAKICPHPSPLSPGRHGGQMFWSAPETTHVHDAPSFLIKGAWGGGGVVDGRTVPSANLGPGKPASWCSYLIYALLFVPDKIVSGSSVDLGLRRPAVFILQQFFVINSPLKVSNDNQWAAVLSPRCYYRFFIVQLVRTLLTNGPILQPRL